MKDCFNWSTLDGRYQAAMQSMKLEGQGKTKETAELKEKLHEAIILYDNPEYFIMTDENNKPVYLHCETTNIGDNENWKRFRKKFADRFCCHTIAGLIWIKGGIPIKGKEEIVKTKFPHWFLFEDIHGEIWFMQI